MPRDPRSCPFPLQARQAKKGDGHGECGDGELDEEAHPPPTPEPLGRNPRQDVLLEEGEGGVDDGAATDCQLESES